jgi:hydroxylamine reductase
MLPAHAYPKLKAFAHLKGHVGTAWQNQQTELEALHSAPLLFTSNCLMPPGESAAERVFTTSVMAYPGMRHIGADENGRKDFKDIIDRATRVESTFNTVHAYPGYDENAFMTTGYGRQTMLGSMPAIVETIRTGAVGHIFLVGGCDGSKPGRGYYADFVKQTPKDSLVLTLACGKFRFNGLDIGSIGPFPRILDMGQCNDAFGAIQVLLALAGALHCGVNELPLSIVLSWYEQKAVCILLTLLSLGIRDIYLGPSMPAFFTDKVTGLLAEKFGLRPIGVPEQDLAQMIQKGERTK